MHKIIFAIVTSYLLTSCSNAVNYHHSERFGVMTLETKSTDPEQPAQASIGMKTRTIVVAPGKKNTIAGVRAGGDLGESTSVISDFNLDRTQRGFTSETVIRSAFLTGEAAKLAPTSTFTAVTGLGYGDLTDAAVEQKELLELLWGNLETLANAGDTRAAGYRSDLEQLAEKYLSAKLITQVNGTTHYEKNNKIVEASSLSVTNKVGTSSFLAAIELESQLRSAQAKNGEVQKEAALLTYCPSFAASCASATAMDQVALGKVRDSSAEVKEQLRVLYNEFGSSHLIDSFVAYIVSKL
jgi:hypothetical protein